MRGLITCIVLAWILLISKGSHGNAGIERPRERTAFESQRIADIYSKKQSALTAQKFTDSTRDWLLENGYSTSLLIIADMGLNMNIKRFYVVNPDSQKLLHSSLVSHGSGGGSTISKAVFSNVPGSLCSSKGRYKIGNSYYGNYGKGYRLHGLDKTNSNALDRLIVLHAYRDQTSEEYGSPLYFSAGCPMLSKKSFAVVDSLIQKETKPVMLVIY